MTFSATQSRCVLVLVAMVSLAVSYLSHRFELVIAVDSSSYTDFNWSSVRSVLSNMRTFGYPLFLRLVRLIADDQWIPFAHWLALMIASLIFHEGLVVAGYRRFTAIWAAGVLMFGRGFLEFGQTIIADSLACSIAIAAAGCFLASSGLKTSKSWWCGLAFLTFLAYQTRPAFLFLIAAWPVISFFIDRLILRRGDRWANAVRRCGMYALVTSIPFLTFCGLRWGLVGHFGLVSFGGYNLIGVVGQYLDQPSVDGMPNQLRPVAAAMLDRLSQQPHRESPTEFLAMERMYNPTIWEAAVPAVKQVHGEDPLIVNRVLSQLSGALLKQHPRKYAQWLVWNAIHAVKQSVRLITTDSGCRLVVVILVIALAVSLVQGPAFPVPSEDLVTSARNGEFANRAEGNRFLELHLLFWTALAFAVAKGALVILVEPANDRYMSAAVLLLPSAIGTFAAHAFELLLIRRIVSSPEIHERKPDL